MRFIGIHACLDLLFVTMILVNQGEVLHIFPVVQNYGGIEQKILKCFYEANPCFKATSDFILI